MDAFRELELADQASVLHPFTNLKDYSTGKLGPPRIITGGKGIRIVDQNGRELIDGFAGLYCVNIGYGRSEVAEAIAKQAHQLSYYHIYAGNSHEPVIRLSERLVKMAPGKMSKIFYGLTGSDANETQAKIVWYYNNILGRHSKKKIISRERGYHGCSVISGSMTGMSFYHSYMDLPLAGILHTGVPHHYWGAETGESEEQFSARRAKELETLIIREGPDTIGGFIAEPVLGTGGIIPPPKGYWTGVQAILRKYDILLIADEVICGFGRLGVPFGCDLYDIQPDMVTVAKGLTSGYVPLSAAIISERVFDVMSQGSDTIGAFSHGYTYSGHTLCTAAANAVLDIMEREDITANAATVGKYFQERMHDAFANDPMVGEVRGVGMLAAIECVADRAKKLRFPSSLKVGAKLSAAALKHGLIARAMPQGDILGFAPPLVATTNDIDQIVGAAALAVRDVADELSRKSMVG